MFCPNCGTKNEVLAVKCSQCGFDLKKTGTPKFKGTMMLEGPPRVNPGAPAATAHSAASKSRGINPNLRGTMVGVAPPGVEELKKQAEAAKVRQAAAPRDAQKAKGHPNLKGTMVGLAPPAVEELRKQAEAAMAEKKVQAQPTAGATAPRGKPSMKGTMVGLAPPVVEELRRQAEQTAKEGSAQPEASRSANSKMKGTMIGVAPPDMSAELEKAKKEILAKKLANAVKQTGDSVAETTQKVRPSQLKGTMMGVAPPDMQQELAEARAEFAAMNAKRKDERAAEAASSPASVSKQEELASEPDPLGGTVLGTSPFATPTSAQSSTPHVSADDFNEDTPVGGAGSQGGNRSSSSPPQIDPMTVGGTVQMPAAGGTAQMPIATEKRDVNDAPPVSERKSPSLAAIVLLALFVVLAIGVGVLLKMKGQAEPAESGSEDTSTQTPAEDP